MKQPRLIREDPEFARLELLEALEKYGKHSIYCRWNRKQGGFYDQRIACTCGLDTIVQKYKEAPK